MHRREFLGASLAGAMAAIFLRLDELMAWWKQWLGTPELRTAFQGVDRLTVTRFDRMMKQMSPMARVGTGVYVSPRTYEDLQAALA
jgi:hypothetical protein